MGRAADMWIIVTLAAACFQIARTSEQHALRSFLGVAEAGYCRFVFAFPIAAVASAVWFTTGGTLPSPRLEFFAWTFAAGVLQILATMALLQSFRLRDFAVGTIYSKTEVVFVSVASAALLGEAISWLGWVGAIICLGGVAWLASEGRVASVLSSGLDPAAWYGMAAGLGFGVTSVAIRAASSNLDGTAVDRAALTLTVILGIQTVVQGAALAASSTSSLEAVLRAWPKAINVAVLSLFGSAAWALAITLENAAKVRTLGQVEIVLAFALGVLVHGESHPRADYLASAVTVAGIVLMVLA